MERDIPFVERSHVAQKLQVLLTCDLDDGSVAAVGTVTFAYQGEGYALELCQAHLDEFDAVMETWIAAARSTGEPTGTSAAAPTGTPGVATGRIREWARSAGYQLSERGRIPAEVRAAYEAAHQG